MKLQENMYVRTKYGISQYKYYDTSMGYKLLCIPVKYGSEGIFADSEDITKARFNVINLIEVGDILVDDTNRKLEVLLIDNKLMVMNTGLIYDNNYYLPIEDIKIKSIVTKEQFEQMSYELG